MTQPTKYPSDVIVPEKGWLFFGGFRTTLTTSQWLPSLGGVWQPGPPLYNNVPVHSQCNLQVNITCKGLILVLSIVIQLTKKTVEPNVSKLN